MCTIINCTFINCTTRNSYGEWDHAAYFTTPSSFASSPFLMVGFRILFSLYHSFLWWDSPGAKSRGSSGLRDHEARKVCGERKSSIIPSRVLWLRPCCAGGHCVLLRTRALYCIRQRAYFGTLCAIIRVKSQAGGMYGIVPFGKGLKLRNKNGMQRETAYSPGQALIK